MIFHTFKAADKFVEASASLVRERLEEHRSRIPFSLALSGGSTPQPVYEALARTLDWKHKAPELYQVDERCVPTNDPRSNALLIKHHLLDPAGLSFRTLRRFATEMPPDLAAESYGDQLQELPLPGFDLAILGMGPDGHTASLFPGSDALKVRRAFAAHTTTDQFDVQDRLTVTLPWLLKSRTLLLLLKGADKLPIIDRLLHGNETIDQLPAKALLKHDDLQIYHLNP